MAPVEGVATGAVTELDELATPAGGVGAAASGEEQEVAVSDLGIDGLVTDVLDQIGRPVDAWAVAATLESFGLRDIDADRYGRRDIFELADSVHASCREQMRDRPLPAPELRSLHWKQRLRTFFRYYAKGASFALPMVVQTGSVLVLGYALWSDLTFDLFAATTVSIGTILSFIVTGGFVQSIGRLGRFYLEQKAFLLAREIIWRLIRLGGIFTLVVGGALVALSQALHLLPQDMVLQAAMYYVLLSALWLTLAVLYTLEQEVRIGACVIAGIIVISVVRTFTTWSVFVGHWIGLTATILIVTVIAKRGLDRGAAEGSATSKLSKLPRPSLLCYLVSPYYLYGVMYFTFLFLDRLVGWSAGDDPLFFWFNTPYEIGLGMALLSMVLPLAQLEYTVHAFSTQVIDVQKRFPGEQITAHNRYFRRFYLRQVLLLGLLSAVSAPLVLLVFIVLGERLPAVAGVIDDPVLLRVFWVGALGYALLVLGLMNGVFFFSLSRVAFVLRALGLGLGVNLVIGFVLSRHLEFWWSVVGMAAGALAFATVTVLYALRVVRRMDYYYYSAF